MAKHLQSFWHDPFGHKVFWIRLFRGFGQKYPISWYIHFMVNIHHASPFWFLHAHLQPSRRVVSKQDRKPTDQNLPSLYISVYRELVYSKRQYQFLPSSMPSIRDEFLLCPYEVTSIMYHKNIATSQFRSHIMVCSVPFKVLTWWLLIIYMITTKFLYIFPLSIKVLLLWVHTSIAENHAISPS